MSNAQFPRLSNPIRRLLFQLFYEYISILDKEAKALFLNYGYADLDADAEPLELLPEEEKHRYSVQLYHHVASAIDWTGLQALELSSGRGGGAWYIMRQFRPASIVGVDPSINAIRFCNRYYAMDGLSFLQGRAEHLQFPDNTFDVVTNIEASLHYANMEAFVNEVVRVLKPGGYFLYTDFRHMEEIDQWRLQLDHPDLRLVEEEDITPNVVRSLELDAGRTRELIDQYVPRPLRKPIGLFAGNFGTGFARGTPKPGERVHLNFVFRRR